MIATRHAGIREGVIHGETGILVDERDVDGMATHMVRVAADPSLAARLGRAGRRHIEVNYSMDRYISTLEHIMQDAVAAVQT